MPDIRHKGSYAALAGWVVCLGIFMMLAPKNWYGPSWFYFAHHGAAILPEGGFGMGACLTIIGSLQLFVLWRNTTRYLAPLFFLSGFVFWTSGIILGAEGFLGHQGIMEAPLMLYLGAHKFITMSGLMAAKRQDGQ